MTIFHGVHQGEQLLLTLSSNPQQSVYLHLGLQVVRPPFHAWNVTISGIAHSTNLPIKNASTVLCVHQAYVLSPSHCVYTQNLVLLCFTRLPILSTDVTSCNHSFLLPPHSVCMYKQTCCLVWIDRAIQSIRLICWSGICSCIDSTAQ